MESAAQDILQRLAQRVRLVREMRGLTEAELAARSGLSVELILDIERAEGNAGVSAVYQVADALSCEARDLIRAHGQDAMILVDMPFGLGPRSS